MVIHRQSHSQRCPQMTEWHIWLKRKCILVKFCLRTAPASVDVNGQLRRTTAGSRQSEHTSNPPSTTRVNLSGCITESDKSAAMCSCACNIIPYRRRVQHLIVWSVKQHSQKLLLRLRNFIPSSRCAQALSSRRAGSVPRRRPPSPARLCAGAEDDAEQPENDSFSFSEPDSRWHHHNLPLMSSVAVNEFRLRSPPAHIIMHKHWQKY